MRSAQFNLSQSGQISAGHVGVTSCHVMSRTPDEPVDRLIEGLDVGPSDSVLARDAAGDPPDDGDNRAKNGEPSDSNDEEHGPVSNGDIGDTEVVARVVLRGADGSLGGQVALRSVVRAGPRKIGEFKY